VAAEWIAVRARDTSDYGAGLTMRRAQRRRGEAAAAWWGLPGSEPGMRHYGGKRGAEARSKDFDF
jgi:hypothetical protein